MNVIPMATFGLADDTVIEELKRTLEDWCGLLNELAPRHPGCNPKEVQSKIAETMIHLAHAYEAQRSSEEASLYYNRAAQIFEAIDQPEQAKQCRASIAKLQFVDEGIFDAEFQRLQARLASLLQGSLPYIETLIALGSLHKNADDLFEAECMYLLAQDALEHITAPQFGNAALSPLEQVLAYAESMGYLYDLRFRLCSDFVYLYRDRDSAKASKYFRQAQENEKMLTEYHQGLFVQLVHMLLSDISTLISRDLQGLLPEKQAEQVLQGLNELAIKNMSLPPSMPRDEILQTLQEHLKEAAGGQEIVQRLIYALQSHVQLIDTFMKTLEQKQAAKNKAEKIHLLEVQLAFDTLRQDIQTFPAQRDEQQTISADVLLKRAQELKNESRRLDMLEGVTTALLLKAELLMALQRDDDAIIALVEARQLLSNHWQHDRGVAILTRLAEAHAHKQNWATVSSICEEGIKLVEQYRYKVTSQYMQSSYLASRIQLYSWGVRSAYEMRDYPLMLQRAELSKCRSVLRYQHQMLMPTQGMENTEKEFRRVNEKIQTLSKGSVFLKELKQKRRVLWDLLLIQRYQKRMGNSFPEFHLENLQSTLAIDEAIIYYYWLDKHNMLITTIDQNSIVVELQTISQEQRAQLEEFTRFVLEMQPGKNQDFLKLQEVTKISALLLPQEGNTVLKGKKRLLISPHRLLHALPFHALQLEADFLIQQFAVSYTPNLTCLLLRYPRLKELNVLALGISTYAIRDLQVQDLKDTESEVEDIQQMYDASSGRITLMKGPEARRKQLQSLEVEHKLEQFSCLHFATHGMNVDSDTPMESYLLLQDSLLDGLEIANWKLNAEIVVLSACCSGQRPIAGRRLEELPGDELFGLQAAFLCAGAKRLLCTLWPVHSHSARTISTSFHRYLLQGRLPEVALQAALKDFLTSAGPRTSKIYYWAPFFLSTLGRPDRNDISGGNYEGLVTI